MNSALETLPGVAKVEINADDRTATISVTSSDFKVEDAEAALQESGFPADSTEDVSPES